MVANNFQTKKGFNYGGDQVAQAPGNLKNILKKKKPKLTDEEKERLDKSKKKSAVHNFLKQGS